MNALYEIFLTNMRKMYNEKVLTTDSTTNDGLDGIRNMGFEFWKCNEKIGFINASLARLFFNFLRVS